MSCHCNQHTKAFNSSEIKTLRRALKALAKEIGTGERFGVVAAGDRTRINRLLQQLDEDNGHKVHPSNELTVAH